MNQKINFILEKYYSQMLSFEVNEERLFFDSLYKINKNARNITLKDKLLKLFSFYQYNLVNTFKHLNKRMNNNNFHITADDSRLFLQIISELENIYDNAKLTEFEFEINSTYKSYLLALKPILKETGGSEMSADTKKFDIIEFEPIFNFTEHRLNAYKEDKIEALFNNIKGENSGSFSLLKIDEKLAFINNAIEYILNNGNGFTKIDENIFLKLVTNDDIINFRKKTHCFRHDSKTALNERSKLSFKEKEFLLNYGLTVLFVLIEKVCRT